MISFVQLFMAIGAVALVIWLCVGNTSLSPANAEKESELIDPNDARQLGTLIGMAGGDVTDAAVARFAIQRFQEQHGRKPTTRDIGTIIGIMRSL